MTEVAAGSMVREARTRWIDALCEAGLGRFVDALSPLLRVAIALHPRDARAAEQRLGASRLGGTPDLPAELPWPADAEGPLPFIGQLDLAALAPFDVDHQLPHEGLRAFFGAWGEDAPRSALLHVRDAPLATRAAPAGVETEPVQGLDFALRVDLPPHTSRLVAFERNPGHNGFDPHTGALVPLPAPRVAMPIADHVRYAEVYACLQHDRGGRHGLLGYDRPMDGALRPDEVMLLRLDADGTIEYPFGEASVLYFLIDRAALARGDLGAARLWYGGTL
jgi:hypothetical protein